MGSEEKCFYVHPWALTATSEFFKSALKKEWSKTEERTVDLRDQSPELFNLYVQYLYSDKIFTTTNCTDQDELSSVDDDPLAGLYVFGESVNDATFQNAVIDVIVQTSRQPTKNNLNLYPSLPSINTIYNGPPTNSPARRLMVDFWVCWGAQKWLQDELEPDQINHEFLYDLSGTLLGKRRRPEENDQDYAELSVGRPCKYHNHGEDQPCSGKE